MRICVKLQKYQTLEPAKISHLKVHINLALYIDQLASPWLREMRLACEVYNACIVYSHVEWHGSHRYHRAQRRKRGLKEGGVVEDSMEKAERLRAKVKCVWVTSEHHLHVLPAICEWI